MYWHHLGVFVIRLRQISSHFFNDNSLLIRLCRTRPFTVFWDVSIEHLWRVWHADRGRLLLLTPGPVPFGLAYILLVETNPFSELFVIFTDYALRISLGTFSILLLMSFFDRGQYSVLLPHLAVELHNPSHCSYMFMWLSVRTRRRGRIRRMLHLARLSDSVRNVALRLMRRWSSQDYALSLVLVNELFHYCIR